MKYRPRRSVELAVGVLIISVGKELPGPQIAGIEDMADQFTRRSKPIETESISNRGLGRAEALST